MTEEIVIFCQHKSHAERRATICTLKKVPGGWDESADTSSRIRMASGGSTARSVPPVSFQIMDPGKDTGYLRWSFECSINSKHNVQVRQQKLNKALDAFAAGGESQVSLPLLAASLRLLD